MPTQKAYRREMYSRLPGDQLGRVETLASATTTTAVVTQLATGTRSSDDFAGKWMLRAEAQSQPANRVRRCSAFTSASGTLTHAGANYADTTATDELLEIIQHEPYLVDNAIQLALARLVRCDASMFPTVSGQVRYSLHELPWITGAGQIDRVTYRPSPVLSRDRYLEKWNTVNSSGVLTPDWWTLAGTSAVMARSTAQNLRMAKSTSLQRVTNNLTLTQTLSLLINGTAVGNGEDLRGKTLTIVGVGWASVASRLRFQIGDGTQTISTSFHSGGSSWEELTATITVASTATTLTIAASVEGGDTTAYVDELYAIEGAAVTDAVRRDSYQEVEIPKVLDQSFASPVLIVDPRGRGGQIIVYSRRPYPQLDATRVAGGTADADSSDAPLIEIATMAIARLYEGLAQSPGTDTSRYAAIAREWSDRAEHLALAHYVQTEPPQGGIALPRAQARPHSARRF